MCNRCAMPVAARRVLEGPGIPLGTRKPGGSFEESPGFVVGEHEGLAPARAWGFESPLPHQYKSLLFSDLRLGENRGVFL